MAWIEIEDFSYTYPGEAHPALCEITLSLDMGAFVVLIGISGSGKSTFGKALAGFLFEDENPNYSGRIIVNGSDMTQLPLFKASERVAYVQQNPEDQFCTLTVQDEIAFGLENMCKNPIIIEQNIDRSLDVVKGRHLKDRNLHTLSGGEKQKVAIASMLALSPDVLILDEPTSNLDPLATQNIFETLFNIRQLEKMTVIIIEHKIDQLLQFDPIIFSMDEGRVTSGFNTNQKLPPPVKVTGDLIKRKKFQVPSNPILHLKDVSVERNNQEILHEINLDLYPGEFTALMGPNGSGKSTLLQSVIGLHRISSGTCKVFGHAIKDTKISDMVCNIGFIFQNPDHQLFEETLLKEITFTSKNIGKFNLAAEQRAREWLRQINLENRMDDHPQKLSYGEKRRLNLVAALLHGPRLLLIDEFLIGQDLLNARIWMDFFKNLSLLGYSILLVIHHSLLTLKYCDRLIFLDEGSIIIDTESQKAFEILLDLGYHAFLPGEDWRPDDE